MKEKQEEIIENIKKTDEVKRLKTLKKSLSNNKEYKTLIEKLNNTNNKEEFLNIKKELFSIDEFKEYMNIKNMLKLNFMKIDGIISSIVSSHKCR